MTEHDSIPWDKGSALDDIAAACIAGDFDAARLGWLRLTEAGTNASYARFAKSAIELRRLRAERDADIEARQEEIANMEHNLGLVIATVEIEQADAARLLTRTALLELLAGELDHTVRVMRLEMRALVARVKALEARG